MKRILLLFAFAPFFGHSQVYFSEDFDGVGGPTAGGPGTYSFPSGWILANVDNRTPNASVAYVNEAWERREDFGGSVTDSVMFSNSYYAPVGAADDWAWTPAITIQPNSVLKWNGKGYDPAYLDGYEVRIMASPNTPTGSTGNIGNMVTNSTVIYSTPAEAAAWTAHQVSLSAYNGQTVRIAFRNNSTDKFLLVIDDVVVEQQINNDLLISVANRVSPYTVLPVNQAAGQVLPGATIVNNGLLAATNVTLKCEVSLDGAVQTVLTSAVQPTIASGANFAFTIPGWVPTQEGVYTFRYYPTMAASDMIPTNDTVNAPFSLTTDRLTMGRDTGPMNGALGIGAGNGGYLGNSFTFAQPVYIDSIESVFSRGYVGRKYAAAIWATDGLGEPTTIVYATDTLLYPSDDAAIYSMGFADGVIQLNAGTYVFTQIEFDSTLALGLTSNIFTTGKTFVDWPTSPIPGWANNEDFGAAYLKPYMLRPIFNVCQNITYVTDTVLTEAGCGLEDGSATLTPAAGYSIMWEDGTNASANNTLGAGYNVYTASDEYCSFTDSVLITNTDSPSISLDSIANALCFGDEGFIALDVTDGTAPYDFIWSDGSMDDTLTMTAGTYSVQVTDANNCQVTLAGLTITQPVVLSATPASTNESCNNCEDGTITVTIGGGTPPYSVSWDNGDNGTSIDELAPGTYTGTVTDGNGCTETVTATITEFDDVSVAELMSIGLNLYPNPVTDNLTVTNGTGKLISASIIDLSGRTIGEFKITEGISKLDLSKVATGTYSIQFETEQGIVSTRIVKQ